MATGSTKSGFFTKETVEQSIKGSFKLKVIFIVIIVVFIIGALV